MIKRILAGLFFLLATTASLHASAVNIYVTQTGSDPGSGACHGQTIISISAANNSANWGSGTTQIGPGTILHICGTFTGPTNTQELVLQGSGTSSNPITILFDTGANFTSPMWSNNSALDTNNQSWIVINGGSNGIIQNTANGTGLANAQPSTGVTVRGGSNVTVENLTIANICQHTSSSDSNACNSGGNNDQALGIVNGANNVTVKQMTIHDAQNCIFYAGQNGDSGVVISDNTLSRCNWEIGVDQAGTSSGFTVTRNNMFCVVAGVCNWDDNSDAFHHNGIIIFPQSSDTMNSVVLSNNWIHDINGNTTAGIFLDPSGTGNTPGILIYNNILSTSTGQGGPNNAQINIGIGITGAKAYNNTVVGGAAQGMSGQLTPTYENNIVTGPSTGELLNSGFSGVISNYNNFFGNSFIGNAGGTTCATLMNWQSCSSLDANSIGTNPNLTATFTPNIGSPVIGSGINLTSLSIPGLDISAPATFGAGGGCGVGCVPRPASGGWDMGAYQSGGAPPVFSFLTASVIASTTAGPSGCGSVSSSTTASICFSTVNGCFMSDQGSAWASCALPTTTVTPTTVIIGGATSKTNNFTISSSAPPVSVSGSTVTVGVPVITVKGN